MNQGFDLEKTNANSKKNARFTNHKLIVDRTVRRILPRSLLSRSLLMILLPLLVTQIISLELFYGNYLNTVSRRLTDIVSGEVDYLVNQFQQARSEDEYDLIIENAQRYFQYDVRWYAKPLSRQIRHGQQSFRNVIGPVDELLYRTLAEHLQKPFSVDWFSIKDQVKITVELTRGTLIILVPQKRLTAGSVWLFTFWIVGSALVLFVLTGMFAWVQFRAIRRLSKAVEKFGKGRDPGDLHPDGSRELRNAAVAFNGMRERILRFVKQRTVILASVSHDLRTPLTRLRLSLAMLPQKGIVNAEDQAQDISEMIADVEEMEQMIAGYLSFARGEGTEEPSLTDMVQLMEDSVTAAGRSGIKFTLINIAPDLPDMIIRANSIRRVITNILDNSKRYGGNVSLQAKVKDKGVLLVIDDDGPGIPVDKQERVFTTFETENSQKGTGLGLSIAKNIIQGHGGDIKLTNSPLGGLSVRIFIPK